MCVERHGVANSKHPRANLSLFLNQFNHTSSLFAGTWKVPIGLVSQTKQLQYAMWKTNNSKGQVYWIINVSIQQHTKSVLTEHLGNLLNIHKHPHYAFCVQYPATSCSSVLLPKHVRAASYITYPQIIDATRCAPHGWDTQTLQHFASPEGRFPM